MLVGNSRSESDRLSGGAKFFPSTVKIDQFMRIVHARVWRCALACAQLFGGPARRA